MNASKLSQLRIDPSQKRRPRGLVFAIFLGVFACLGLAVAVVYLKRDGERRVRGSNDPYAKTEAVSASAEPARSTVASKAPEAQVSAPASAQGVAAQKSTASARLVPDSGILLTVSGYIINRERIEVSPRMQGVVEWIGVRKGDRVTKGQVVVRLENAEQRARILQAEAGLAAANVSLARAELAYGRAKALRERDAVSTEVLDESRLSVDAAKASVAEAEGQLALVRTYLDWTIITSPVDGLVLEKLVEPGELVVPMSFGGPRGPSTALLAVADPNDLQVELDINEADLAKIRRGGPCRVSPEAYPDKRYEGVVAEIAPEANRQKGTLQIKVQILKPDNFLTPELTAKVEFLP